MPSQASSNRETTLSQNIRLARASRKLTQRQLAEKLGVDSMLVSKWERGWHRPSEENLSALAEKLGRSIAWFYTEREPERSAAA